MCVCVGNLLDLRKGTLYHLASFSSTKRFGYSVAQSFWQVPYSNAKWSMLSTVLSQTSQLTCSKYMTQNLVRSPGKIFHSHVFLAVSALWLIVCLCDILTVNSLCHLPMLHGITNPLPCLTSVMGRGFTGCRLDIIRIRTCRY